MVRCKDWISWSLRLESDFKNARRSRSSASELEPLDEDKEGVEESDEAEKWEGLAEEDEEEFDDDGV